MTSRRALFNRNCDVDETSYFWARDLDEPSKPPNPVTSFFANSKRSVKQFVNTKVFQRGILVAILINTLSMGLEHHLQVSLRKAVRNMLEVLYWAGNLGGSYKAELPRVLWSWKIFGAGQVYPNSHGNFPLRFSGRELTTTLHEITFADLKEPFSGFREHKRKFAKRQRKNWRCFRTSWPFSYRFHISWQLRCRVCSSNIAPITGRLYLYRITVVLLRSFSEDGKCSLHQKNLRILGKNAVDWATTPETGLLAEPWAFWWFQPEQLTVVLEYCNFFFTALFCIEMLFKMAADGVFGYLSNGYNLFDCIIVVLRWAMKVRPCGIFWPWFV